MKKRSLLLLALPVLLCGHLACAKKKAQAELPEMGRIALYGHTPGSPLEDRIKLMPARLLELYRQMDSRPDYRAYAPAPADKALVLEYLRLMPPAVERVFKEKCVGLYFVEGFTGNGMTSWVLDEKGALYFHMTLNPAAFGQSLSETLTEREKSCFSPAEGAKLEVNAGQKYRGLAYAIFHEAAHAADYIEGLTPAVDPDLPPAYRPAPRPDGGLFTAEWEAYGAPKPANDYAGRDRLTFYGLGGGPKINISEAPGVYKGLAGSPFVSLYGSKSWAEDFAELVAYSLITRKLGQPYEIKLSLPGAAKTSMKPMAGKAGPRAEAAVRLLEKLE